MSVFRILVDGVEWKRGNSYELLHDAKSIRVERLVNKLGLLQTTNMERYNRICWLMVHDSKFIPTYESGLFDPTGIWVECFTVSEHNMPSSHNNKTSMHRDLYSVLVDILDNFYERNNPQAVMNWTHILKHPDGIESYDYSWSFGIDFTEMGTVSEFNHNFLQPITMMAGCTFRNLKISGNWGGQYARCCDFTHTNWAEAKHNSRLRGYSNIGFSHVLGVKYWIHRTSLGNPLTAHYTYTQASLDYCEADETAKTTFERVFKTKKSFDVIDVKSLLENDSYLEEKPYVPEKGILLDSTLEHIDSGKPTFNLMPVSSTQARNYSECVVLKMKFHVDQMSERHVEQSTAEELGLDLTFTSAVKTTDTGREFTFSISSEKVRYYNNALANKHVVCSSTGWLVKLGLVCHTDSFGWVLRQLAPRVRINSYGYKPEPEWQLATGETLDPTKFMFGFELEVQGNSTKKPHADLSDGEKQYWLSGHPRGFNTLIDRITEDGTLYCKSDSSIGWGFEIVSHPISWGWWLENNHKLKDKWEYMRERNIISHDSGRCGLHVHIGRRSFKQYTTKVRRASNREVLVHEHGKYLVSPHLGRFSKFVYDHQDFCAWLSRRPSRNPSYALFTEGDSDDKTKGLSSSTLKGVITNTPATGHRGAINFSNPYTVEYRLFRGTLLWRSFAASIEFLHALHTYTSKPTTVHKLDVSAFIDWCGTQENYDSLNYVFAAGKKSGELQKACVGEFTPAAETYA